VKVSRPYYLTRPQGVHEKIGLGTRDYTKFALSGAHDVIVITLAEKNDLCTKELREVEIYSEVTGRGETTKS